MERWKKGLMCISSLLLLLLLVGCGGDNSAEERALALRGEYLAAPVITAQCVVTADYGQRLYDFTFHVVATAERTTLTLTAPQELAGMVVELTGEDSTLTCQGVLLETGTLSDDGLTPITAVPALLNALEQGFIYSCWEEEGTLCILCRNPEEPLGTGQEITLWLSTDTGDLQQGEIMVDGTRVITCQFEELSRGTTTSSG